MEFDPKDHLIQLERRVYNKKTKRTETVLYDYLEVKYRLIWFRRDHPQGTITTDEIHVDLDREVEKEVAKYEGEKYVGKEIKTARGYARFKATVTDEKGGSATGYGSEAAIDFGDFLEKAETKAVGRALAMLGIGTQFVGQELNEGERLVDAPVVQTADEPTDERLGTPIGTYKAPPSPRHHPVATPTPTGQPVDEFRAALLEALQPWQADREALQRVFGTRIWAKVERLPTHALEAGLATLRPVPTGAADERPAGEPPEDQAVAQANGDGLVVPDVTPLMWSRLGARAFRARMITSVWEMFRLKGDYAAAEKAVLALEPPEGSCATPNETEVAWFRETSWKELVALADQLDGGTAGAWTAAVMRLMHQYPNGVPLQAYDRQRAEMTSHLLAQTPQEDA